MLFYVLKNYLLIKILKNMKKMLFSAIAMVAFAGNAFASNEIVVVDNIEAKTENQSFVVSSEENTTEDKRECYDFAEVYYENGKEVGRKNRRVCSNIHTEQQLKKLVEDAYGTTIQPAGN